MTERALHRASQPAIGCAASAGNAESDAKIVRDAAVCAPARNRDRSLPSVFSRGETGFKKWRVGDKQKREKPTWYDGTWATKGIKSWAIHKLQPLGHYRTLLSPHHS